MCHPTPPTRYRSRYLPPSLTTKKNKLQFAGAPDSLNRIGTYRTSVLVAHDYAPDGEMLLTECGGAKSRLDKLLFVCLDSSDRGSRTTINIQINT